MTDEEKTEENQNITYIDLEANLPHIISEVICIKCKKKGYVIETGQIIKE